MSVQLLSAVAMDEYDFSAPAFHDFDTEDDNQHEEFDDTYFGTLGAAQVSRLVSTTL